jgi:hypothetical protein
MEARKMITVLGIEHFLRARFCARCSECIIFNSCFNHARNFFELFLENEEPRVRLLKISS